MISVIYCSISPERAAATEARYRELLDREAHEIIGFRDARSLAEAYNRGIDQACGDVLIFSHDDIEFLDQASWLPRFKAHMSLYDILGLAGTTRLTSPMWANSGPPYTFGQVGELDGKVEPYRALICAVPTPAVANIQAVDGLFFAVRRPVVERIRFDEATFDGFHCYDIDFTYSAYRAGFSLTVATDLPVLHLSKGHFDQTWQEYAGRFMKKHGEHLPTMRQRPFQHTLVGAMSKTELLEIMAPPSQRANIAHPARQGRLSIQNKAS